MGKLKKITYSLKDVAVVQAPVSYTNHRSDVDPKIKICGRKSYPIFVAPMASVTDENNYNVWIKNGLTPVVPRSVQQRLSFEERMDIARKTFVSVSLAEAVYELYQYLSKEPIATYYICIDIAHGTLNRLYDICKKLKSEFGNRCVIMTGNIANPKAYSFYADAGIDYVRVSVGTGSRCLKEGTKIKMADGTELNIEDISVGDYVLTMEGPKCVTKVYNKVAKKLIRINNNIETTPEHKFFVIEKKLLNNSEIVVDDDFIKKHGVYIEASKLTNDYLLVED